MIRTVFILLVYIVAPALLIYWAAHRIRMRHKPTLLEIALFFVAAFLLGTLMVSLTGKMYSENDAGLGEFVTQLEKSYQFPLAAKFAEGPAVYAQGFPRFLEVRIYGVNSITEQNKVAEIGRRLHRKYAHKPILLNFLREEIWLQNADGSRIPLRDKEVSLRKIRLE